MNNIEEIIDQALEKDRETVQKLNHDSRSHNQNASHLVLVIPGIRDLGSNLTRVQHLLEQTIPNIRVVPIPYKYFHAIFLLFQKKRIDHARSIFSKVISVKQDKSVRRISIIAHSFGTWVFYQFYRELLDINRIQMDKIILCGGILNLDAAIEMTNTLIKHSQYVQIINERGDSDRIPIIAEWISEQFSAIGVWGINSYKIEERIVPGGHGVFFTEEYIKKYWLPLFNKDTVIRGVEQKTIHWYHKLLVKPGFKLKELLMWLMIVAFVYIVTNAIQIYLFPI